MLSGPLFPTSANGAPLHVVKPVGTTTSGRAQSASLLTHGALVVGLILLGSQSRRTTDHGLRPKEPHSGHLVFFPQPDANEFGRPSLGKASGGGEEDPRPARHGQFAPPSSLPLAPPRRIVNSHPEMPVPVAVFDENATQFPLNITYVGIPWMKKDSDSAGPGKNHGFGSGKDGGMGDDEGPSAGQGEKYAGPYKNAVSMPKCAYCPDPQYSDEARQAKLQGSVTLQVLVDAEGRAAEIRVMKGIGLGLDERAVQAIRGWKFIPARDAMRHAVPSWVTVETVFRLF